MRMKVVTILAVCLLFYPEVFDGDEKTAVYVCPTCAGTNMHDNGRSLICRDCLEMRSRFEFVEIVRL